MAVVWHFEEPRVPARALVLSFAALAVPVSASFLAPGYAEEQVVLLWLLALVPAFLLAYYRGWQGVATALAAGMATLALAQAGLVLTGRSVQRPDLLMGVVAAYVAISLGLGWFSERLHRRRAAAELLALTDELTELPNRRRVHMFIERALRGESEQPFTLVMFDIDDFKSYNDAHGHPAGDEVLCSVAGVLRRATDGGGMTARYGGEEFLAVLPGRSPETALSFVERVRDGMRGVRAKTGGITVSAGLATFREGMTYADLLEAVDHALYEAKRSGRNRVHVFEPLIA